MRRKGHGWQACCTRVKHVYETEARKVELIGRPTSPHQAVTTQIQSSGSWSRLFFWRVRLEMSTNQVNRITWLSLVFTTFGLFPLFVTQVVSGFQQQPEPVLPSGNPMEVTRITVEHVHVATDHPFEKVINAFEKQVGQFDPAAYQHLNAGVDPEVSPLQNQGDGRSERLHALPDQRPRRAASAGWSEAEGDPISGRKSPLCAPDDAARHSGRALTRRCGCSFTRMHKARRAWNTTSPRRSSASSATRR